MVGTTVVASNQDSIENQSDNRSVPDIQAEDVATARPTNSTAPVGEEQALETHEVIELQSFSERKAWIEEKIKFLESLPPIEVFVGLHAIKSAEDVPGLPTRFELEQWVAEHDAIEKETEIFDKGELKKLRQLTKAATQRNLSPEDTDVIELTLTTIYTLDKLLHLLRDRSENLEMMSTRLFWEENRRTAWIEHRQIIEDLQTFAASRARWNATIYELSSTTEDLGGTMRRGSIGSLASTSSDNITNLPAFSRGARFRLAELLSRDAAHFSGRVSSLRHGKVTAAGKALDKLIDQSRKPVPDELLDEQDRLEEKCITEMENVTKFALNLVVQWRKADEIYVETKKDHLAASNLLEEIEVAKLNHPTARQSSSFLSRVDTIIKRLAIRGNPSASSNLFPCPEHFLFPDQKVANDILIRALSDDVVAADKLSKAALVAAKEYRDHYEEVKRVETLLQDIGQSMIDLLAVIKKFEGTPSDNEDGSPPDLASEACLDPTRHALFIAVFPSLKGDTEEAISKANQYLRTGPSLVFALNGPDIDMQFKENVSAKLEELSSLRSQAVGLLEFHLKQLSSLRDSRRIDQNITSKSTFLKTVKIQAIDQMERDRWRQQFNKIDAPPTPESPTSDLPAPPLSCSELEEQLHQISVSADADIFQPLQRLSPLIQSNLKIFLNQRAATLQRSLEDGRRILRLFSRIQKQSLALCLIRDDFNIIMTRIEDAKLEITGLVEGILHPPVIGDDLAESVVQDVGDIESQFLEPIQKQVDTFVDGLFQRVPFVSLHSDQGTDHRFFALKSPPLQARVSEETAVIPFDLSILDSIVRADTNTYASRVSGNYESLAQLKEYFGLAKIAVATDAAILSCTAELDKVAQVLRDKEIQYKGIPRYASEALLQLDDVLNSLVELKTKHAQVAESLSSVSESVDGMNKISQTLGVVIRDNLSKPRFNALNALRAQFGHIEQAISGLQTKVRETRLLEHAHHEELRAAELRQRKEEEERVAAEEAARLQAELRQAEEIRQRELAALHAQEAARQRDLRILAEKERTRHESAMAEKRRLDDMERQVIAERLARAEELQTREEAARAQVQQERADALEKLRAIEAQLEQERSLHAERQLAVTDLLHRQRSEMDELARKQSEIELLAQENARQAQIERDGKQRIEEQGRESEERLKRQYLELQQLVEVQTRLTEMERAEKERAERMAKQHVDSLKEQHKRDVLLTEDIARRLELARAETELAENEAKRLAQELEKQQRIQPYIDSDKANETDDVSEIARDVFGIVQHADVSAPSSYEDLTEFQTQVFSLRKRLRSLCIDEIINPAKNSNQLPTQAQYERIYESLVSASATAQMLPSSTASIDFNMEVKALRSEITESQLSLTTVENLVNTSISIQQCDSVLSDLLEHIDSYPAAPLLTSSAHESNSASSPEEQLAARLAFTESLITNMHNKFERVRDDHRIMSEHVRINQTWAELREMANDLLQGRKSRPPSVISRGSSTSAATCAAVKSEARSSKKSDSYSSLSVTAGSSGISKGKMLAPLTSVKPRRAVSNTSENTVQSRSRASSIATARSVSVLVRRGPVKTGESRSSSRLSKTSADRSMSVQFNSSLYGTTFASRQRTISLSGAAFTPPQPPLTNSRSRVDSSLKRGVSPAISETSSYAYAHSVSSRGPLSSKPGSTWSRAPRDSISSLLPRASTPIRKAPVVRKKYIADPKNKLDVAVGDVINNLEVGINVESISNSWRDQSGKYWIGDQDPKLCFCRILRSQTVMVRVGGGWTELSRFIKDHFADSFRIGSGPESPSRHGSEHERWISSATLLEAQASFSPPRALSTPEPNLSLVPSFSLITPSGHSPKSLKSLSPPSLRGSSPLTPLQFMRRAEPGPDISLLKPAVTPSKSSSRGRINTSNSTSHNSVWRP